MNEYENWKKEFVEKMGENLSANDLDNLDKIIGGLETENANLVDRNGELEKQNKDLKNDNWDMYKRIERTPSSKGKDDERETNKVMSYEDLFKKEK